MPCVNVLALPRVDVEVLGMVWGNHEIVLRITASVANCCLYWGSSRNKTHEGEKGNHEAGDHNPGAPESALAEPREIVRCKVGAQGSPPMRYRLRDPCQRHSYFTSASCGYGWWKEYTRLFPVETIFLQFVAPESWPKVYGSKVPLSGCLPVQVPPLHRFGNDARASIDRCIGWWFCCLNRFTKPG